MAPSDYQLCLAVHVRISGEPVFCYLSSGHRGRHTGRCIDCDGYTWDQQEVARDAA